MNLGIVGHERLKFTGVGQTRARTVIRSVIKRHEATLILSGRSPLGGIDIWAEEEAAVLGLPMRIHAPEVHVWDGEPLGKIGYKQRNLAIARESDLVVCIVVKELPKDFPGARFPSCYHCKGLNPPHVKSGGCWTAWRCARQEWVIL